MRCSAGLKHLVLFLLLIGAAGNVCASESVKHVYFQAVPDLPLPPGMVEVGTFFEPHQAETRTFPGRRVGVAQARGRVSANRILQFYRDTLPALRWRSLGEGVYIRGQEVLSLSVEPIAGGNVLSLRLAPAPLRP